MPGDKILEVHAEDGDRGNPREVRYGLVSEGNPFTPFFNLSDDKGKVLLILCLYNSLLLFRARLNDMQLPVLVRPPSPWTFI